MEKTCRNIHCILVWLEKYALIYTPEFKSKAISENLKVIIVLCIISFDTLSGLT